MFAGLRLAYILMTGVDLFPDWDCYDLGDFYDEFDDEDVPPLLRMPVRDRALVIGVSLRVF